MTNFIQSPSVLASLRHAIPRRQLTQNESLRVAELQAAKFRQLVGATSAALPESVLAALPRISIQRRDLPTSGLSYWDGDNWIIALNRSEPDVRQRFTLMHEYKHIIDHGSADQLYTGTATRTSNEQAEYAADYFAGCLLMPKTLMKQAWSEGVQTLSGLASLFQVSTRAVEVRLAQIGLTEPTSRCAPGATNSTGRRARNFRTNRPTLKNGLAA